MNGTAKPVHFAWMGAFWGCTQEAWANLVAAVENDQPFDLVALGVKELPRRPGGLCRELHDERPRQWTGRAG